MNTHCPELRFWQQQKHGCQSVLSPCALHTLGRRLVSRPGLLQDHSHLGLVTLKCGLGEVTFTEW